MSEGMSGYGSALAGATTDTVGNIISIEVAGQTRDSIDISTMDSTSAHREFVAGLADVGELTATLNYDGSSVGIGSALNVAFAGGTAELWTVTFPDTSTFAGTGFITNLSIASPRDDKITQTLSIKLTGVPTFTASVG